MYGQPKKPMTTISTPMRTPEPSNPQRELGTTETRAMVKSSCGKASSRSITRLMTASTQPPRKPASAPRKLPRTTETKAARKATTSEMRAP